MKESTNKAKVLPSTTFLRKSGAGFTLIEFLVYTIILAVLINIIGSVALNVFKMGARTDIIQEVAHNGRFTLQKIGQAVNSAKAITLPETEGSSLVLEFQEEDKNPTVFDVFENTLRIKEGNKEHVELTSANVNVENIVFKRVASDGLNSVKIEINISFNNQRELPEYDFESFFTGAFTAGKY
jgi:type II secretory pathway pseudopilin PulG